MKQLIFLLTALSFTLCLSAQNVGIGETSPNAKLVVKGSVDPLQTSLLIKDGNNIPLISVNNNGRLGINTINPAAPLHVYAAGGGEMIRVQGATPYISFFDQANIYKGYLWYNNTSLQLGTANNSNLPVSIAPGRNTAATFQADGNVGIGITNPAYRLDINGRARIQSNGETPGIWFNNTANTNSPGFVGMFNDNNIGMYGSGGGWSFLMDVNNGHIGVGATPDYNFQMYIQSDKTALYTGGTSTSSTAIKLGTGKISVDGANINTNTTVFVHKALPSNSPSSLGYTVINNPYCNNNPAAILMVTLNGTYGSGNDFGYERVNEFGSGTPPFQLQVASTVSFLVFYNGLNSGFYGAAPLYAKDKWCIRTYSGNFVADPAGFNFNVLVVNPN